MNKVDYVRTILGQDITKNCYSCLYSSPLPIRKKYFNFMEDYLKFNICKRNFARNKVEKTHLCIHYIDKTNVFYSTIHRAKFFAIPIAVIDIISWIPGKKWYLILADCIVIFFNFFMAWNLSRNRAKTEKI